MTPETEEEFDKLGKWLFTNNRIKSFIRLYFIDKRILEEELEKMERKYAGSSNVALANAQYNQAIGDLKKLL